MRTILLAVLLCSGAFRASAVPVLTLVYQQDHTAFALHILPSGSPDDMVFSEYFIDGVRQFGSPIPNYEHLIYGNLGFGSFFMTGEHSVSIRYSIAGGGAVESSATYTVLPFDQSVFVEGYSFPRLGACPCEAVPDTGATAALLAFGFLGVCLLRKHVMSLH